jgi:hypothetical protein
MEDDSQQKRTFFDHLLDLNEQSNLAMTETHALSVKLRIFAQRRSDRISTPPKKTAELSVAPVVRSRSRM